MSGTARWLVLRLPAFRVERCGHAASDVVALTVEEHGGTRLCAVSPGARAQGVLPGMTAAEARSLEPELKLEPVDAAAEDEDRLALLRALERLSDRLWPLSDDAFALEVSRVPRRDATLEDAVHLAQGLGHVAYGVVADDPDAAYALCVAGGCDRVVERGQTAAALADLPVDLLRPPDDLRAAWREIGVLQLGDLARLPASAVRDRYGVEGARLYAIARGEAPLSADQALSASINPGAGEHARPQQASAVLPGPTTTAPALWFVLQGLIGSLCERMARLDRAIVRVHVQLDLERGLSAGFRARLGRPSASAERWRMLLQPRVDALRLEAPAVAVAVRAEEHCPLRSWQSTLYDRAEATEPLPDLVARLVDALGESAVFTPCLAPDWRPERGYTARQGPQPLFEARQGSTASVLPLRPTLLEPRSLPAEVRTGPAGTPLEGTPTAVRWGESWEPVRRARGPERLSGDWWREGGGYDRAYWSVDVGVTLWLYWDLRLEAWFVHGYFD